MFQTPTIISKIYNAAFVSACRLAASRFAALIMIFLYGVVCKNTITRVAKWREAN